MMAFRVNATIFEATANSSNVAFLQTLSPNMWLIANILTALMIFPLVNHIFIPCLPCISMRGRMAVGMVISVCAVVSAGVIENSLHGSEMEPLYTLLLYVIPTVLGTIPETLIQMSGMYRAVDQRLANTFSIVRSSGVHLRSVSRKYERDVDRPLVFGLRPVQWWIHRPILPLPQ